MTDEILEAISEATARAEYTGKPMAVCDVDGGLCVVPEKSIKGEPLEVVWPVRLYEQLEDAE